MSFENEDPHHLCSNESAQPKKAEQNTWELTLAPRPKSFLTDRWNWTAVPKRWPSRRRNSSGFYIPVGRVIKTYKAFKYQ